MVRTERPGSGAIKRAPPLGGRTCLIVDRDASARLELATLFAKMGARARATESGDDVLPIVTIESIDVLVWALDDVAPCLAIMKQLRALPEIAARPIRAIAIVRPVETPPSAVMHLLKRFDEILEKPVAASKVAERAVALLAPPSSWRPRTQRRP